MTAPTALTCPDCGLKPWDAPNLQPGDMVCPCDDPFGDAADAITRLDDGTSLPDDAAILDVFERHCQQDGTRLELRLALADACTGCEGGTGRTALCDDCREVAL